MFAEKMVGIAADNGGDVSPVRRRHRSRAGGEKRKSERSPSPITRKMRTHRRSGGRGIKKRFLHSEISPKKRFLLEPPSPIQRAKRKKVATHRNSSPANDLGGEAVVRRSKVR